MEREEHDKLAAFVSKYDNAIMMDGIGSEKACALRAEHLDKEYQECANALDELQKNADEYRFRSPLRDVSLKFLSSLFYCGKPPFVIRTCDNYWFGELHRIYWDVANLEGEDRKFLAALDKFVHSSQVEVTKRDLMKLSRFIFRSPWISVLDESEEVRMECIQTISPYKTVSHVIKPGNQKTFYAKVVEFLRGLYE